MSAGSSERRTDPRVRRSRLAVLDASLRELAEVGYGAFTIDSVATRSGVARSTIYRLWPGKAAIIADAFETLDEQPRPSDDEEVGPREQVEVLVRHLAAAMESSIFSACLPALVDGAEHDRDLRAYHLAFNERRRAALTSAISRAKDAGEVSDAIDPELAGVALAGAVIYRRLMTATALGQAEVGPLVDLVVGGRPPPPPPGRRSPGPGAHRP